MGIRVSTFGKFTIERDGKTLDNFITTKAMLLFTYLAMNPGEHTRKKIAFMFWSETNDKQALKNLRTILSSLRQQVGDCLTISPEIIAINSEQVAVEVDATQLERGYAHILSSHNKLDVLQVMEELAQLYRGDFLETTTVRDAIELDNWISEKQRHFRQLFIRLLYDIGEVAEKQKNYEVGLRYAWLLVKFDPLWDDAQRQLMRLLASTHRTSEALLHYEQFVRLLDEELGSLPETETTALYEQIRSREFKPTHRHAAIVLPDMPFVEPAEQIELAQRMLNTPHCRLLTIFGISGIGKTSLVTRLAFHRQHLFRDGAYLVSIQHTHTPHDLPYLIADALGIDLGSQHDEASIHSSLIEHLKTRQLLLVLDNYEHLLPNTDFVERIIEEALLTQVVITSQMPLNLFREWLMPLHGLRVPSLTDPHPETFEAVRLFELTAQRINPHFDLHKNMEGVIKICQLVDGLPLALAITAGWTQILPVSKIIEHISEGEEFELPFQFSLPMRHQSVESMLDYTWKTLTFSEEYALISLCIFNAAFDIEKAKQIGSVDSHVLTPLVQKSLIQKFDDTYRMHQLIWRYARKKLAGHILQELIELRYTDYFTLFLKKLQAQKLLPHEYVLVIEAEYRNIWNFDWMRSNYQPIYILAVAPFLSLYWEVSRRDSLPDILRIFESVAQDNLSPSQRAILNLQIARLLIQQTDYHRASAHLHLALQENSTQLEWEIACLIVSFQALLAYLTVQQMSEVSGQLDERILETTQLTLAVLYVDTHNFEAAQNIFLFLLENTLSPMIRALLLASCGTLAAQQQRYPEAIASFTDALQQVTEPFLKRLLEGWITRISDRIALG